MLHSSRNFLSRTDPNTHSFTQERRYLTPSEFFYSTIHFVYNNLGLNMKDPLKNRKENDLIDDSLLLDFEDEEEVK